MSSLLPSRFVCTWRSSWVARMEAGVHDWAWSSTAVADHSCPGSGGVAARDRQGEGSVSAAGGRGGRQLLRGGPRRLLAASLPGSGGGGQCGGGLVQHRGQSPA